MKESFVFYSSFAQAAATLGDKARLKLYDAVVKFGLCCAENETELEQVCAEIESSLVQNRNVFAQFLLIKQQIIKNFSRYFNGRKGAEFGCLGGAPVKNKNTIQNNPKITPPGYFIEPHTVETKKENPIKEIPPITPKENITQEINNNITPLTKVSAPLKKFQKPSIEEVREYCLERKNYVNPEDFIDFYTSKGWMVGKNPMKDWKAAVRIWEREEKRKHVESAHWASYIAPDAGRHHSKEELERFLGRKTELQF